MYETLLIQLEKSRTDLNSASSYTFDFGPKELTNMVGIPQADANFVLRKMLENKKFRLDHDKLQILDISEIVKQTEYYRKMQRIEKARRESATH
jgi:hypothetical protein